ncbi:hypothetical protein AAVH_27608 [Aphelenchoides avenae]|nr:hypothetical protein AAVH_27608 [Aphelenchus avenae]
MSAPTVFSSIPSPKWMSGIRKIDDGWTARGPGIWTDEEFVSSDDDIDAVPFKHVQKKPTHVIRMERAESALKRAERVEKTPFIVQKRRSVNIVQKKRVVVPQPPVVAEKVTSDIAYARTALMQIRSDASPKPAQAERTDVRFVRHEPSTQTTEEKKEPCMQKAQAKIFLRAIHDIRAYA